MRAALVALALAVAAGTAAAQPASTLTVYAAASLTDAFPKIDPSAKYSFAGSNTLAAQIREGAPADVFASADVALPRGLHRDRLCSKPVVFARNTVVVIVPKGNPAHVQSVYDLRRHGVKLVVANPGVPVGKYTIQVLRKMHLMNVLQNVVSRENDVREVLAKVALGEADAGFVYSTDARTVPGKVRVVKIPARAEPNLRYGICVVLASTHKAAAQGFVKKVIGKRGRRILRHYGFLSRR